MLSLPKLISLRYDKEVLKSYNTIPLNSVILFPVDKRLSVGFPFTSDGELKEVAKKRIDMLPIVSISLDGIVLSPSRIQSNAFQLKLKQDIFSPEIPEGVKKIVKGKYKAVGEGYWVFLKPNSLTKGNHEMPAFASCETRSTVSKCSSHIDGCIG